MSAKRKAVPTLTPESTREEIIEYLKAKPPIFTESVEVEGMRLCFANPELVEPADDEDETQVDHAKDAGDSRDD